MFLCALYSLTQYSSRNVIFTLHLFGLWAEGPVKVDKQDYILKT